MRTVKTVNGQKIVMDSVSQALALKPREKYVSPWLRGREFEFYHDGLYYPKVYEARGLVVSAVRDGVEEFLADWTAFEVYMRVGIKIQQEWVSLLHYDMALELDPLEIPPQQNFLAAVRMLNDIGEAGLELRLSLRGVMHREML